MTVQLSGHSIFSHANLPFVQTACQTMVKTQRKIATTQNLTRNALSTYQIYSVENAQGEVSYTTSPQEKFKMWSHWKGRGTLAALVQHLNQNIPYSKFWEEATLFISRARIGEQSEVALTFAKELNHLYPSIVVSTQTSLDPQKGPVMVILFDSESSFQTVVTLQKEGKLWVKGSTLKDVVNSLLKNLEIQNHVLIADPYTEDGIFVCSGCHDFVFLHPDRCFGCEDEVLSQQVSMLRAYPKGCSVWEDIDRKIEALLEQTKNFFQQSSQVVIYPLDEQARLGIRSLQQNQQDLVTILNNRFPESSQWEISENGAVCLNCSSETARKVCSELGRADLAYVHQWEDEPSPTSHCIIFTPMAADELRDRLSGIRLG